MCRQLVFLESRCRQNKVLSGNVLWTSVASSVVLYRAMASLAARSITPSSVQVASRRNSRRKGGGPSGLRQLVFLESRCRQNKVLSECSKASLILFEVKAEGREEGGRAQTSKQLSCRSLHASQKP